VIAGDSLRYSSTHRVSKLDDGTYQSVVARCERVDAKAAAGGWLEAAVGGAGGRGAGGDADGGEPPLKVNAKQIRAEQALLNDLEFEWVRQFWVQGALHAKNHGWWHEPVRDLTGRWCALERRMARQLATLRRAADPATHVHSRAACGVATAAFDVMLEAVTERKKRRDAWAERLRAKAYRVLAPEHQPVEPVPGMGAADSAVGWELDGLARDVARARARFVQLLRAGGVEGGAAAAGAPAATAAGAGAGADAMKKKKKKLKQKKANGKPAVGGAPAAGKGGASNWAAMQALLKGGGSKRPAIAGGGGGATHRAKKGRKS